MTALARYHEIPNEMKCFRQWVCWKYEERGESGKPTKVPYNPRGTGEFHDAKSTDPTTWGTFEDALSGAASGRFDGIGFVLTANDPYAMIDLDDASGDPAVVADQTKIYQEFHSYAELSPSGKGAHIIVRGAVPSGRKRGKVEIYSNERFMTMTGNVIRPVPINDYGTLLNVLWALSGKSPKAYQGYEDYNEEQRAPDEAIIETALKAANGEKFATLLTGSWELLYPPPSGSQSEADGAFVNILAFYTQNREQITRIFHNSPLGQRQKAKRLGYVKWLINTAFDRLLPPIDISNLKAQCDEYIQQRSREQILAATPAALPAPPPADPYTRPPGLMGEIADFVFASATRPVKEVAIAAAIAMLAGIAGRAYNVSGTGLNQYVLLVAETGVGKEQMSKAIGRLFREISSAQRVPAAMEFKGPGNIASGQAIIKYLARKPSCIAVIGEIGMWLQQICHPKASLNDVGTRRALLSLYNKSGFDDMLDEIIYSDKDKNTAELTAPAFSFVGDTTPGKLYQSFDENLITEGMLPRFLIVETKLMRVPRNRAAASVRPAPALIDGLAALAANALSVAAQFPLGGRPIVVGMTPEAESFLDGVDARADGVLAHESRDAIRHLWNRAHVKTLKLAALVAVGENMTNPVIGLQAAQWAAAVVEHDIRALSERFETGGVGQESPDQKQLAEVRNAIKQYLTHSYGDVAGYGVPAALFNDRLVTYTYISRRCVATAAMRHDKQGSTAALKRALQNMIDGGELVEIGKLEVAKTYNYSGRVFGITNSLSLLS